MTHPPIAALYDHRVIRLTILDCGTFSVRNGERIIGIPAFLVETDRGARILIDGGFPPSYWTDARAAALSDDLGGFGALLDYGPDQTLPAQLALAGTTVGLLDAHILTHGHIDHIGALPLIRCPLILTAEERQDPKPRYFGAVRPIDWPDVPTHRITTETRLCHGLTLLPTPGHTPGHLSILLGLPETGPVILAADAINRASEPAEGYADAEDPVSARASGDRLLALQRDGAARLIYGHDSSQWETLRKAPSSYG